MSHNPLNLLVLSAGTVALLAATLAGSAQQPAGPHPAPRPAASVTATPRSAGLAGYRSREAVDELRLERQFAAIPSAAELQRQHRFLTSEPHPAGSERNNLLARYIADQWKLQGWENVVVHRYDVLQSSPREVSLEMVAPVPYKAGLREDAYDIDPDTKNRDVSAAYLGFSASGEVTAPVVYAFSGNPQDYDVLRKNGIDVKGKIVLVRYSNPYSYRGFKALTAQREGAAAVLIYSDPAEDGYTRGKVFPDGPWGPESHIQRGAITYDFIVPGDPLTPGWPALPEARRIAVAEAVSVPAIMAVPLSWRDAKPLLEHMDGPRAPKAWQGTLPITYRLGGSAVRVHLKVDMDTSVVPNYVVEGRIRGAELPEEWVVLGNHRDAWAFGGVDPSSGTASQLELTRGLGALLKQGLRPKRTIVMCSWDGEEYGLTGSTEWGEHFKDELRRKGVAYINVDSSASGPNFVPDAVPSLAPLLVEISKTLDDPSGSSLYAAWRASAREEKKAEVKDADLVNTKIGSGSDHTVFLNHVGLSSVLLQFDGPYGVYHSMYDNHFWMNNFGDPGFKYHALMSQLWGVLALRLANAAILPFDFASYAASLRGFVQELDKGSEVKREVKLRPLLGRIDEMDVAARGLNAAVQRTLSAPLSLDDATLARLNAQILQFERNWLDERGIPDRPWFKHLLYSARYTYAHLELPGLTEAIEARKWSVAREQARILEDAVAKNTALLREARAGLEPSATRP